MFKSHGEQKEQFWALDDVSFQVETGESLGIIGKNGAGKSTLLKILSRITPPTSGRIICRGRIASLLEVGTGFHQELTGRENIYMNGSILGMRKAEIDARFDEIVEFAAIEKFLDTPLKHYSSGMQLRLAFAVAAHLDPEILIIDEVLAVGDAEFQKKCMKKMEDVSGQGRTLLFVSHNLPSLKAICRNGILLKNGKLIKTGKIDEVVDHYSSLQHSGEKIKESIHYFQPHLKVHSISVNRTELNSSTIEDDVLELEMEIEFFKRTPFELEVHVKRDEALITTYANFVHGEVSTFQPGTYQFNYKLALPQLRSGLYKLDIYFTEPFASWFALSQNAITLDVINSEHHIFLNTPGLKWGAVITRGEVVSSKLMKVTN
jgi:lipopolysaccharide transport system ATP-binding protein